MARHSSATPREESPHESQTPHVTRTFNVTQTSRTNISKAIRRRAESIVEDRSIDAQSRALIRYGLETNDPWLAELVRRADAGETLIDTIDFSQTPASCEDDSSQEKIERLTQMICRAGDEAATKSAALLVLMATLENSTHPKALANTAKHLAFTRCGELNLYGIVDAQITLFEGELLA